MRRRPLRLIRCWGPGCVHAPRPSFRTCLQSRPDAILGPVDALKLRSSMAIFADAVPDEPLFRQVLTAAS